MEQSKRANQPIFMQAWSFLKQSLNAKVYAAMILLFIVSCIIEPNYFSINYVNQMLLMASFLGILAMGQTLSILTGGIDLSIPYILNLTACILVQESTRQGDVAGIILTLGAGLALGLLNGIGIGFLKIAPIVMTLSMNAILGSVALLYTSGSPKGNAPKWAVNLATGNVLGIKSGIIVWLVIAVVFIIFLRKTSFGRKIYAVGNNYTVSFLSGVNNRFILMWVYGLSGLFAAIAGCMLSGFSGSAFLGMGDSYQMQSVAAVVVGGTSILGGKGGYVGTLAGTAIIFILTGILTSFNIQEAGRNIIYGVVILAVFLLYGRSKQTQS